MNIIYCKSNTLAGKLIRLFTFSQWNHVAIECNGIVIDSTAKKGVAAYVKSDFLRKYDDVRIEKLTGVSEAQSWLFLKSQVGKGYDFRAIVALPFRKSWQDDTRWFCSELVAAALIKGGRKLKINSGRVTPRDLWVML